MTFYERREVKDLLAYLKVLVNPHDSVSLRRIVNVPLRGIGSGTLEKLGIGRQTRRPVAARRDLPRLPHRRVSQEDGRRHRGFASLLRSLVEFAKTAKPSEAVRAVLEKSGYLSTLEDEGTQEARMRVENLKELVNSVAYYETNTTEPSLEGYLDQVSLSSDADDKDDEDNRVTLMTMHNAKGLEFREVFVTGMEEGLFPHANSMEEDKDVEEERRLCYVGMTRAMDRSGPVRIRLPFRVRHRPVAVALAIFGGDSQGTHGGGGESRHDYRHRRRDCTKWPRPRTQPTS
jgi:DNA helicase-2/ATP-dependent DNA helicase PcrA